MQGALRHVMINKFVLLDQLRMSKCSKLRHIHAMVSKSLLMYVGVGAEKFLARHIFKTLTK